jgi:hypothetical protein
MRTIPKTLIVLAAVAMIGLVAGTVLSYAAERGDRTDRGGDRPDRGGPAAGGSGGPGGPGGGPPMPAMKGPADGGGRDMFRTAPIWRDITDEDVAQIMAFVDENMPWMKAELEKQKETNPAQFKMVCRHLRFDIDQLKALKAADPEAFKNAMEERKLRAEAADLATKVRAATDEKERTALKEQLRVVIGKLFDKELEVRNAQIAQIEKRIEGLRKELKDRQAVRGDVVATRLEQMLKAPPEGSGEHPAPTSTGRPGPGKADAKPPAPEKTPPPPDSK